MTQQESRKFNLQLIIVLGAVAALTPFAIDMYLPAMPAIAKDLLVNPSLVQATLTAYTAGFAVGQLLHGPLSDSYGRRPILLIGIVFFVLTGVMSALSSSIYELTWFRAAQGFSGAAAAVIIQALVRDMFKREEFARTMSFVTLVMTIAPLIAPMIGGYLSIWWGWRAIFWLLAIFALFVIALVLWKIPETLPAEKRVPLHFRSTIRSYVQLMATPSVVGLVLCGGFSFAGMFTFLTVGSFVYIDLYHVSPENFAYLFALNVVCLILMTMVNGRLVVQMGSHFMLRLGLSVQLFAGLGLITGQLFDFGLWGVVIPVPIFIGTLSTIGSNSMACLLGRYPHIAGTASSLAGTLRFGIGSLVSGGVALMPSSSAWPLAITMLTCAILSSVFYWFLAREA